MERIRIFKGSPVFGKFYIIFGAFFALTGIVVTAINLTGGFDERLNGGDWSFVLFILQGILISIMGWSFIRNQKYYMEWDDREIRYLLPYTKRAEVIKLDEIESVNIKLFEIELILKNGIKTIKLDNLEFEDIRRIKERFGGIAHDKH
ncbi:MAG TPA: hypothetical protein PK521_06640 [Bacteroidales bacterium]|jgi:hypothetical protein|nr:hypothetical protein [Bacteroidales bacterium]HOX73768.1 hypothetical protein [Bacteroidales bacterium]HQM68967.1 hypothetical protein [Bacteroidales bacterium]